MDFYHQNYIYLRVIKNINDLNEILKYNGTGINPQKFTDCLNMKKYDLNTDDVNIYLSSILLLVFNLKKEKISVSTSNTNKLIIINFINTILQELKIQEIELEVYDG